MEPPDDAFLSLRDLRELAHSHHYDRWRVVYAAAGDHGVVLAASVDRGVMISCSVNAMALAHLCALKAARKPLEVEASAP